MKEFDIRLNRKMVSDLLLNGAIFVEPDESNGRYKLSELTSMHNLLEDYNGKVEVRCYILYCTATRKQRNYRVRLVLRNNQGEDWYVGKIIFPSAPI